MVKKNINPSYMIRDYDDCNIVNYRCLNCFKQFGISSSDDFYYCPMCGTKFEFIKLKSKHGIFEKEYEISYYLIYNDLKGGSIRGFTPKNKWEKFYTAKEALENKKECEAQELYWADGIKEDINLIFKIVHKKEKVKSFYSISDVKFFQKTGKFLKDIYPNIYFTELKR